MGEQDEQLHRFLEQAFQERIGRFPQTLTALGRRDQKDRLDDQSESAAQDFRALLVGQLEAIGAFARDKLSPHAQLNVRVFEQDARQTLARLQYRAQEYLVNQKFGLHTDFPAFMINMHGVADLQDARDYVARLRAFGRACDQVIEELERREAMGIVPPAFLFPQMLDDCRRFVGDPSDTQPVDANVLLADLRAKLAELGDRGDPGEAGKDLLQAAAQALRETVLPGYERLIAFLERQESRAPAEGGAWSLPDGEAYYRMCLARHTTTALSADEIHRLGLDEVARIRGEMIALKGALGFGGYGDDELGTLFSHARDHDGFYYPQTPAGRAAYMEEMNAAIVEMKTLLPQYFASLPKDELLVKAVEPHRERTAGIAFYQGPAEDGSRPGIFYIN
ncbi:MAG TPA: DUF885 domain-containing protein, partial [Noviherbaspirillum sp.]|nr:DUF885 domain-containing protein [Noviherbaspirillum sp.]